jgi:hypothetical protein
LILVMCHAFGYGIRFGICLADVIGNGQYSMQWYTE